MKGGRKGEEKKRRREEGGKKEGREGREQTGVLGLNIH